MLVKNISKNFRKTLDNGRRACYNIDTVKEGTAQKSQSKKFEKIFQKHLTKQKFSAIIKSRKQRHDKINGGSL